VFLFAPGFHLGLFLLLIINNLQKIIKKVSKKVCLYQILCNFIKQTQTNEKRLYLFTHHCGSNGIRTLHKFLIMDIRTTRRLLNLSQRELADMCGLSIGTILRAEKSGLITAKNHRLITNKLREYATNNSTAINTNNGTAAAPIF